jgi:lipoprotein-anchoring transpeptidase ErfK/SrfK
VGRSQVLLIVVACSLSLAAPAHAQDPPDPEPVIADGVTVAGVEVGGLTAAQATTELAAFFGQPVRLTLGSELRDVRPQRLGAQARVAEAVAAALAAAADRALPLGVTVSRSTLRSWIKRRAKAFDEKPVSAHVVLKRLTPRIVAAETGRKLVKSTARSRLRAALAAHRRDLRLPVRTLKPAISAREVGPAVVIRRGSRRLVLYRGSGPGRMHVATSFPVAVGMPSYPTPLGSYVIRNKARNPWWYPPNADWAKGAKPIPPGPGNPLGTRWMGLGGGVGIHGTYNSGSIGSAASHGCIRMHLRSAEWLYERVRIGTAVFIVAS